MKSVPNLSYPVEDFLCSFQSPSHFHKDLHLTSIDSLVPKVKPTAFSTYVRVVKLSLRLTSKVMPIRKAPLNLTHN